ncbi:hypothetical protein [Streptomyces hainanensis]|uniref:Uncharacterized protein n=1 Tax=Streptomyces hainanensis TaxID=402648 RepID=A0A4R4SPE4_9ACTN|nr:hypothetical protein [Streptomyces hainanensis]TDC64079.1 hypothetical protein E1283_31865 [Streptomyces hainanensis]
MGGRQGQAASGLGGAIAQGYRQGRDRGRVVADGGQGAAALAVQAGRRVAGEGIADVLVGLAVETFRGVQGLQGSGPVVESRLGDGELGLGVGPDDQRSVPGRGLGGLPRQDEGGLPLGGQVGRGAVVVLGEGVGAVVGAHVAQEHGQFGRPRQQPRLPVERGGRCTITHTGRAPRRTPPREASKE